MKFHSDLINGFPGAGAAGATAGGGVFAANEEGQQA